MHQNPTADRLDLHPVLSEHEGRSSNGSSDVSPYLAAMAIAVGLIIAWAGMCTF